MTRRRGLTVAVSAGAALLGVVALWWWTHAEVLPGAGNAVGFAPTPADEVHVGLVYPDVGDPEAETLTLSRAEALVRSDTAAATTEVSVCRIADDSLGAVSGPLSRYCSEIVPVENGTPFRYGGDAGEMLVLTVRPTRPGTVRVDAVEVSYATGPGRLWRRGTQLVGPEVTLRSR